MAEYRKTRVPDRVRCEVARRYGALPGVETNVPCHYCWWPGRIYWYPRRDGTGSTRVVFGHELDHVVPERDGGATEAHNIVLACRRCNRRKGVRPSMATQRGFSEPALARALSLHGIPRDSPLSRQVLEFEGLTDGS